MIIEGEFFSGGHLRWNLGWPTPNYAGAFLVTLLALHWAGADSRWRWALLAAEAGGLFLLAKTYSRGAVVAWGAAWLFGIAASRGWRNPAERMIWAGRLVVLAVMMAAVGFGWSRVVEKTTGPQDNRTTDKRATASEVPSTEDGSVVNRLALWRGGLEMIAAAPLTGWGAGESGRAYMNWFQDVDRDEGYATMVNSYLHVGVEHGLPILAAVLWVGGWLLLAAWRTGRAERGGRLKQGAGSKEQEERLRERGTRTIGATAGVQALAPHSPLPAPLFSPSAIRSFSLSLAAGAAMVAWAVANVFTTLWIEPKLWIAPVAAAMVIATATARSRGEGKPGGGWRGGLGGAMLSLGISLAVTVGLYGAGRWLGRSRPEQASPGAFGTVVVTRSSSSSEKGATWHVWPDPTVLGAAPGKELRRWLETGPVNGRLVVHRAAPLQPGEIPAGAERMMLFGRQVEWVAPDFPSAGRELWLIHPTVPPPAASKSPKLSVETTTLILPQIDETGNGPVWREWAKQTGARIVESTACGLDIRAVWPGMLNAKKPPALPMKIP